MPAMAGSQRRTRIRAPGLCRVPRRRSTSATLAVIAMTISDFRGRIPSEAEMQAFADGLRANRKGDVVSMHTRAALSLTAPDPILDSARASTFQMRGIRWFWPGRFATGKLGLIGGLPDKGKGLI